MESGRYIPPQARLGNNSALASFNAARDPDYRMGGGFGSRGLPEGNYSGESLFPRNQYRRDVREGFAAPPPGVGLLPPARRGIVEDEYTMIHGSLRNAKVGYMDVVRDVDRFRDSNNFRDVGPARGGDDYRKLNKYQSDNYQEANGYRDYGDHRRGGFSDRYEADDYDQDYRSRDCIDDSREGNQDLDFKHSQHADHCSEHDWRKHERRSRDRDSNWENYRERPRDRSLDRGRRRDNSCSVSRSRSRSRSNSQSHSYPHSRSCSYDAWRERSFSPRRSHSRGSHSPRRSRSPRRSHSSRRSYSPRRSWSPRSYSESRREDSGDDGYHESSWRRGRDDRRYHDRLRVAPSATLVVKGLSQKTVEDDLYRALVEWGPLRHVRVIKERGSGASRGFAFIDFPSVDAARKTMEGLREDGLTLDGRHVYFEYSSKPTGGVGAPQAQSSGSSLGVSKHGISAADWMCTVCGCVNFARRMLCFQCNEGRADDAPAADMSTMPNGRKGFEAGPTHILVVRGLDDHVNEDMLHAEFSKYASLKDLRLIRDRLTNVSRGFAFVHFHSVEEATAALEATNGMALEKNGQPLRVAFAKSSGPGSSSQASSIAAAAIEAATFAQQYNSAGRTQKEGTEGAGTTTTSTTTTTEDPNGGPQSGYVWDEASGYYYDAASGFYYDPHRCLFYDGNQGLWYSYDEKTQQYVPYVEASSGEATDTRNTAKPEKGTEDAAQKLDQSPTVEEGEVDPCAPAEEEKAPTLAEAVQAAAIAAQAAAKKDKEKIKEKEKEIRQAMKGSLLASKKKLLTLWKQRQNEGLVATSASAIERSTTTSLAPTRDLKPDGLSQSATALLGTMSSQPYGMSRVASGNTLEERQNTHSAISTPVRRVEAAAAQPASLEVNSGATAFKTDASALGSYAPAMTGLKRRFTEAPQPTYRDRAAERRNLYGSSSSAHNDLFLDLDMKDRGAGGRSWDVDMPFPPGVGLRGSTPTTGAAALGGPEAQAFEVITAETALDERNVGNRMLRSMGWQEGSGLGKDGTGIVEPVQALSTDVRAGLGSQGQRKADPRFETQPGDSYRIVIQKKALARFHDMV